MRPYRHVALGGTFDRLHVGHDALLRAAFSAGETVFIGLTTDAYLASHPKAGRGSLLPYPERARRLRRWLRTNASRRRWEIVPLEDRFGRAVGEGIDALVVSSETRGGGRAVNAERRDRGLGPLPLLEVPLVLADDLLPVSSTRIRDGTLGPGGERLAPIRVGLATEAPADLPPLTEAVRRAFRRAVVVAPRRRRAALTGGPARSRAARLALGALRDAELAVGVARARQGGWWVAVRTARVGLAARPVGGGEPRLLTRGVVRLLRPARKKPL